jgi:broad specificity phosphatase PhoE
LNQVNKYLFKLKIEFSFFLYVHKKASTDEGEPKRILVVSHGWFIRELIKYFVFELKCKMPVDHSKLNLIHKNTAFSIFHFNKEQEDNSFTCSSFNSFDHLSEIENKNISDM